MEDKPINAAASGLAAITAINQLMHALISEKIIGKDTIINMLNDAAEALEQAGERTTTTTNRDAADQLRMIAASYHDDL